MGTSWRKAFRCAAGYAAVTAVGVAAGGIIAISQNPGVHEPAPSGVIIGEAEHRSFTIRGDVAGLVPGSTAPLMVEVSNPGRRPIRLLTIAVEAGRATAGCRAAPHLHISSYNSRRPHAQPIIVAGHDTAVVPLRIRLPNAPHRNQDSCQNAAFTLHYAGTARRLIR